MATSDVAPPQGISLPGESKRPAATGGPKRRTAHLFGREYKVVLPSIRDPRLHVAAVLITLQVLGQTVLGFRLSIAQILICLAVGALIEFVVAFFKDKAILWPASGLLTGNSTAFILRVPGTLHGQWWSLHGIEIFIGVVALGMATKYLIRWRGRHIFNPSNVALVVAFVALGPQHTEPLDLWWIPMGPWMILTYAILIVGGLLIAWELKLIGLVLGFMVGFAVFTAIAIAPVPDHCMVASWHVTPVCGRDLWQILVTSPEILIFALFMVPDPRTVPDGPVARVVFGVIVRWSSGPRPPSLPALSSLAPCASRWCASWLHLKRASLSPRLAAADGGWPPSLPSPPCSPFLCRCQPPFRPTARRRPPGWRTARHRRSPSRWARRSSQSRAGSPEPRPVLYLPPPIRGRFRRRAGYGTFRPFHRPASPQT